MLPSAGTLRLGLCQRGGWLLWSFGWNFLKLWAKWSCYVTLLIILGFLLVFPFARSIWGILQTSLEAKCIISALGQGKEHYFCGAKDLVNPKVQPLCLGRSKSSSKKYVSVLEIWLKILQEASVLNIGSICFWVWLTFLHSAILSFHQLPQRLGSHDQIQLHCIAWVGLFDYHWYLLGKRTHSFTLCIMPGLEASPRTEHQPRLAFR